jgi:hypothetical protein
MNITAIASKKRSNNIEQKTTSSSNEQYHQAKGVATLSKKINNIE